VLRSGILMLFALRLRVTFASRWEAQPSALAAKHLLQAMTGM